MLLGTPRLLVIPEELEGFLQVPGAHQRRVPANQRREPLILIRTEIPRILQQQPASSFDGHFVFGSELAPQLTANSIHGLIEVFDDVESVKQDLRVDRVLAHQLGVRRPHIHAYDLERMATPSAHFLGEELLYLITAFYWTNVGETCSVV